MAIFPILEYIKVCFKHGGRAMETILQLAAAMLFFGFGWVLAIDQDRAWDWHLASMRRKGLSADQLQRTSEWEFDMAWRGYIFMGMGVLILLVALCNA
jgi:hypothetical protein